MGTKRVNMRSYLSKTWMNGRFSNLDQHTKNSIIESASIDIHTKSEDDKLIDSVSKKSLRTTFYATWGDTVPAFAAEVFEELGLDYLVQIIDHGMPEITNPPVPSIAQVYLDGHGLQDYVPKEK